MRNLWPIEQAVLEAAVIEFPELSDALCQQINCAQVVAFRNTGVGSFSELGLTADTPALFASSPLDCAHGNVGGTEDAMGFLVFLTADGRLATIEGYCLALEATHDIDFATVQCDLKPPTYSSGPA